MKLLGLGGGTAANTALGAVGHLSTFAAVAYLVQHRDEHVNFDTSLGFLAIVVLVGWAFFEMARRTNPSASSSAWRRPPE